MGDQADRARTGPGEKQQLKTKRSASPRPSRFDVLDGLFNIWVRGKERGKAGDIEHFLDVILKAGHDQFPVQRLQFLRDQQEGA